MTSITPQAIGQQLDAAPLGAFHRRLLALIAAGMFFDSFDIYIAGSVLAALTASGESTLALNAAFVSVTFAGMMVGAWLAGVVGDRYGRRFAYQFNLLLYGGASLAAAFAPNMQWLIGLRLIMGIGMGAEIVIGYATLAEFIPATHRGKFGSLLNLIINSSLFFATFLGWLIIPHYGWRWMFAIAGVGALAIWFIRRRMPESPRWLASQGRLQEAEAIVRRITPQRGAALPANPPGQPLARAPLPASRLRDLFAPGQRARTLTGITVLVVLFTVNYAFVSWMPSFLVKEGKSVSASLGLTSAMFAGGPVGSLIAFALVERLGRKAGLVLFSIIGMALGCLYPFMPAPYGIIATGFAITSVIYVLSSLSVAIYVPELFPTHLRLRGAGLCNALGRATNIVVPYAIAGLFAGFGIAGVLALIVGALLLQAVVVGVFGVETKNRGLGVFNDEAPAPAPKPAGSPIEHL